MLYELIRLVEDPELSDAEKIAALAMLHDEHPEAFTETHPHSEANLLHYASINGGIDLAAWLISYHPEFSNQATRAGDNILFTAARNGNNELVHYYLHHYPELLFSGTHQGFNHHQQTIVHAAMMGGDDEIIELVYDELGPDTYQRLNQVVDIFGATPLHYFSHPSSHNFHLSLHEGFDVHHIDDDGNSLLHVAAKSNNLEFFKALLERGLEINQLSQAENRLTPLMIAAHRSSERIVDYCIANGGDINQSDSLGNHVIHYAAMQSCISIMQTLLAHQVDIDKRYFDGSTALMIAARKEQAGQFHFLLEQGANSKIRDNKDLNLAHYAACGGDLGILKTTRDLAVDLNAPAARDAQNIALFYAALHGHEHAFLFLIKHGANPDTWNTEGWHILHAAAQGGNVAILEFLHQQLISLDLVQRNEQQCTAIFIAMSHYQYAAFEYLLARIHTINHVIGNGYTPLHLATTLENVFLVLSLLDLVEDIDARTVDEDQNTALMLAAQHSSEVCFDALLSKGANPQLMNAKGRTLLHAASQGGNLHIVDSMVDAGLDIDHKAHCDQTALMIAAQSGHYPVFNYLLKAGANPHACDAKGWLLSHYAADGGCLSIIAKCHALGLDFTTKTHNGKTPKDLAHQQHADAYQFIVSLS